MHETILVRLDASGHAFALAVARFNDFVTSRLEVAALDALRRHGADPARLTVVPAPGAWELPLIAKKLAESGRFAAVIALGCVIRGQTPHFEYVAGECAKGLASASLLTGVPISFGVITADTMEQAIDRAGGKAGNKGADAAMAALETVHVLAAIGRSASR